jgi:hypothetical protein
MDAHVEDQGLVLTAVRSQEFADGGKAWMYFAITCVACHL